MFLNLFKQGGCTTPTPAEFNADGYPVGRLTGTKPGCGVILNPNSGTANYVVKWVGAGAMQIGSTHVTVSDPDGCDTRSSSTLTLIQTDPSKGCNVTFHELINPGSSMLVYFPVTVGGRTVTYSGFRNAVLVLQSNEAALEKCADIVCFDPNYLGTISSGRGAPLGGASVNPLAVRTLDLTHTSNGNISDFDAIFSPSSIVLQWRVDQTWVVGRNDLRDIGYVLPKSEAQRLHGSQFAKCGWLQRLHGRGAISRYHRRR